MQPNSYMANGEGGVITGSGWSGGAVSKLPPRKLAAILVVALVTIVGLIFLISSLAATPGRMYLSPQQPANGNVDVQVKLNTGGENVGTVESKFTYPTDKLEFVSITPSNVFGDTVPGNGNNGNTVTVVRGHQPGVTGDVVVATVKFRIKASGSVQLVMPFGEATRSRSDAGNVVGQRDGATFTIEGNVPTTPGRLYFNPSSGSVSGDFPVEFRIDASTESVSAIDARITYDNTKLELLSIDDSTSAFETRAPGGNVGSNGSITIIRGHQAGVTGDKLVAKFNFRVRQSVTGTAGLNFTSGEALRAVGGTNIIGTRDNASYTVGTVTGPDNEKPSKPGTPVASLVTSTSITLSWAPSTDNVGIKDYRVLRNGTRIAFVTNGTTFTDTGLTPGTEYTYTIRAADAADNISDLSDALTVSTSNGNPQGCSDLTKLQLGDLNCDGFVDEIDYAIQQGNWRPRP